MTIPPPADSDRLTSSLHIIQDECEARILYKPYPPTATLHLTIKCYIRLTRPIVEEFSILLVTGVENSIKGRIDVSHQVSKS